MNKYEKNIMANTNIMKITYVVISLVNMLLPFYKDWHWRFSIFQLVIVIIWFFGLLGGLGYFGQATPILPIGIVRIVQIGAYMLFRLREVNWYVIGVYVILDIIFLAFLLFDKATYVYEIVEEEDINDN